MFINLEVKNMKELFTKKEIKKLKLLIDQEILKNLYAYEYKQLLLRGEELN